jgi:hypothetical protein
MLGREMAKLTNEESSDNQATTPPAALRAGIILYYHERQFETLIQKIKFLIETHRTETYHGATFCGAHSVNL